MKFATTVMDNFIIRWKPFDNSPVAKFKRSIIDGKESQGAVDILNGITLVVDSDRIKGEKFFFSIGGLEGNSDLTICFSL